MAGRCTSLHEGMATAVYGHRSLIPSRAGPLVRPLRFSICMAASLTSSGAGRRQGGNCDGASRGQGQHLDDLALRGGGTGIKIFVGGSRARGIDVRFVVAALPEGGLTGDAARARGGSYWRRRCSVIIGVGAGAAGGGGLAEGRRGPTGTAIVQGKITVQDRNSSKWRSS
jgi:hypothetical protein